MQKAFSSLITLMMISFLIVVVAPKHSAAQDGAALYKKHCKRCHGDDGKGKEKMIKVLKMKDKDGNKLSLEKAKEKLNLLSQVSKDLSDADMQTLILKGRDGTKMPTLEKKLKPEPEKGAAAIVKHVRELQKAGK